MKKRKNPLVVSCLLLTAIILLAYFYSQAKKAGNGYPSPTPFTKEPTVIKSEKITPYNSSVTKLLIPDSLFSLSNSDRNFYAISAKDGNLIQISEDGKTTPVTKEKILSYSYNDPYISYVSKEGVVHFYDTSIKKDTNLSNLNLGEIIATANDIKNKNVYLLGEYSAVTRGSKVYRIALSESSGNNKPLLLTETSANRIEFLNENYLLLFEYSAGMDQSLVWIFDLQKKIDFPRYIANSYSISPDRAKILFLSSTQSSYIDLDKKIVKNTVQKIGPYVTWKDKNIVISGSNTEKGVLLVTYDVTKDQIVDEQIANVNKKLTGIIGYINGALVAKFDDESISIINF